MVSMYVVTTGSYSDYGIFGIFSTREKAEEVRQWLADSNDVEEWEVDNDKGVRPGHHVYDVRILKDGTVVEVRKSLFGAYHYYNDSDGAPTNQLQVEYWLHEPAATARVYAESEQHAIKVANERRTMAIANNTWPDAEIAEAIAREAAYRKERGYSPAKHRRVEESPPSPPTVEG